MTFFESHHMTFSEGHSSRPLCIELTDALSPDIDAGILMLIGYKSEADSESSEAAFFCPYCLCRSHSSASCLAANRARIKTSDPPLSG